MTSRLSFKIELKSSLLCSSGHSEAIYDHQPILDEYGIPFIPGRTFKGLLKESLQEICEIEDMKEVDTENLLKTYFGTKKQEGKIKFDHIRIEHYKDLVKCREEKSIPYDEIRKYFTKSLTQTSINEESTALDNTLRTYLTVKRGIATFSSVIEVDKKDVLHFKNALLNLRKMGLRRNRGFGSIRIEDIIKEDVLPNTEKNEINSISESDSETNSPSAQYLQIRIKNLQGLIFSRQIGDQNTVATTEYIPANSFRGLVASLVGSSDPHFPEIIFNRIHYGPGLPIKENLVASAMPKSIGFDKIVQKDRREPLSTFSTPDLAIRSYGSWFEGLDPSNAITVHKTSKIHVHRESRVAGQSTSDDGSIFYYESIDQNQEFEFNLYGEENYLKYIQSILPSKSLHWLGTSRSAEYGKIEILRSDIQTPNRDIFTKENQIYYIVLQSPCILLNQLGISEPSKDSLNRYLEAYCLSAVDMVARTTSVQNYVGVKNGYTDQDIGYEIGSIFQIRAIWDRDISELIHRGLGERLIEGYGKIRIYTDEFCKKEVKVCKEEEKVNESRLSTMAAETSSEMGTEPKNLEKAEIVKKVETYIDESQKITAYKIRALECANKVKDDNLKLANHQIYRMLEMLDQSKTSEVWKVKFDEYKGKRQEAVLNNLEKLEPMIALNDKNKFDENKIIMRFVLQYLVQKQKRE